MTEVNLHHVSHSQIEEWQRCPQSWFRTSVMGLRGPANGNLFLGSAYHKFIEEFYGFRKSSGVLLPPSDCLDAASSIWDTDIQKREVVWGADNPNKLKSKYLELIEVFLRDIALDYSPIEVEHQYSEVLEGVQFVGSIDMINTPTHFCEHKTAARGWTQERVDKSNQASSHAWVARKPIDYTYLVAVKTAHPYIQVLETHRAIDDILWWISMARGVIKLMKTGICPPNEGDQWCRPGSCFHYDHCMERVRKRIAT